MRVPKVCIARLSVWVSAACLLAATAEAEVRLPQVISSHMVLQRDMPVPIWGTASPGEKVTVSFRGQSKDAVATADGKWMVKLDPLKAGGPDVMKIAGSNTIALEDVLVGEVWVGSGQSNMDLAVPEAAGGDPVLAEAAKKSYPRLRLIISTKTPWQEATPGNIAPFSALLFSFGAPLQKELDVPVGLIEGAIGATASRCWLSGEAYESDPGIQAALEKYRTVEYPKLLEKWKADCEAADAKAEAEGKPAPGHPRPPREAGKIAGPWRTGLHFQHFEDRIRPILTYGIRGVLWDQGESGTGLWGVDQYSLMGGLIRGWRKEWGQGDFPFLYVQKPSGPGCAWDDDDPVTRCSRTFSPLPKTVPSTSDGRYNEEYIRLLQYPNTAMVTSSDLGPNNHPTNKSGYGARAARVALGTVYGRKLEIYGPVYQSHRIEGDKVRVSFNHTGKGLAWKHGEKLQGFAIVGEDKVFHWADAAIDGDTVVVSSPKVKKPAAVRYAWGKEYPWANLFNKDGLPALPLRTDAWE